MRIITDENLKGSLETAFASREAEEFAVVYLEKADRYGQRGHITGLDDVLSIAPQECPVLMLGWLDPIQHYRENPKWHASLAYPKVGFLRLPASAPEMLSALEVAKNSNRPSDPLAIALLTAKDVQNEMGILDHNLYRAEQKGETALAEWEVRARKTMGEKPRDELIRLVRESVSQGFPPGQFVGQEFSDVCVDVEGTLLKNNGNVREDVFATVRKFSESRPITVWSGGDLKKLNELLCKAKIPYKLISKGLMRGARVAVVIDDLPEESFKETYGVGYGEYIKI